MLASGGKWSARSSPEQHSTFLYPQAAVVQLRGSLPSKVHTTAARGTAFLLRNPKVHRVH
jgi:hypothetical protein